jgi:hypothetical protein
VRGLLCRTRSVRGWESFIFKSLRSISTVGIISWAGRSAAAFLCPAETHPLPDFPFDLTKKGSLLNDTIPIPPTPAQPIARPQLPRTLFAVSIPAEGGPPRSSHLPSSHMEPCHQADDAMPQLHRGHSAHSISQPYFAYCWQSLILNTIIYAIKEKEILKCRYSSS